MQRYTPAAAVQAALVKRQQYSPPSPLQDTLAQGGRGRRGAPRRPPDPGRPGNPQQHHTQRQQGAAKLELPNAKRDPPKGTRWHRVAPATHHKRTRVTLHEHTLAAGQAARQAAHYRRGWLRAALGSPAHHRQPAASMQIGSTLSAAAPNVPCCSCCTCCGWGVLPSAGGRRSQKTPRTTCSLLQAYSLAPCWRQYTSVHLPPWSSTSRRRLQPRAAGKHNGARRTVLPHGAGHCIAPHQTTISRRQDTPCTIRSGTTAAAAAAACWG